MRIVWETINRARSFKCAIFRYFWLGKAEKLPFKSQLWTIFVIFCVLFWNLQNKNYQYLCENDLQGKIVPSSKFQTWLMSNVIVIAHNIFGFYDFFIFDIYLQNSRSLIRNLFANVIYMARSTYPSIFIDRQLGI